MLRGFALERVFEPGTECRVLPDLFTATPSRHDVDMTTYMVEYTYTDAADERTTHRPVHRAYLESLVGTGQMLAYGRFGEDGPAGALLLIEADSPTEVEALLAADPYATHGLIGAHRVREWIGTWGAPR